MKRIYIANNGNIYRCKENLPPYELRINDPLKLLKFDKNSNIYGFEANIKNKHK